MTVPMSLPSLKSRGHVLIILAVLSLCPGPGTERMLSKHGVSEYVCVEALEDELSHEQILTASWGWLQAILLRLTVLGREAVLRGRAKWVLEK